jgi:glucosylceramidase
MKMTKQTRRDCLKGMMALSAASVPLLKTFAHGAPASSRTETSSANISLHLTAGDQRYALANPPVWQSADRAPAENTIVIRGGSGTDPVLGFGAAFTDAACYVLSGLPETERETLLQELFQPAQMGLSVCRLCVGSSDYARSVYSYDEGAPDSELSRFSIAHDREYILPIIRRARQINPNLFLLASPWSPPAWMKDNNSMLGGTLRRRYLGAYANYLVKFLQAFQAEGVEIDAITPQNEVDTDQDSRMPACLLPQEIEVEFVGQHLGPAMEKAGLKTKIWLIDHNYNLWGRAICELDDEKVRRYSKSIAWHGYLGQPEWVQRVFTAHPDAEMFWTEGGPDIHDPRYATNWSKWSGTFSGILRNRLRCIIGWNLALDEMGKPNVGPFSCGGLVTVHSATREIVRSGQYWAFAHYSRALQRGAGVIESDGDIKNVHHVAALNPDGSYAVVLTNTGELSSTVWLRQEHRAMELPLQPDSIATLVWK